MVDFTDFYLPKDSRQRSVTIVTDTDVCLTVLHQYNDVNNQQDKTTLSFINPI